MSRDAFLKRTRGEPGNTSSHKRAAKQEKEWAKRLNGRCTPGSGNGTIKGDVRVKRVARLEVKTTKHRSFSVTLEMLEKIENAALPYDELPVLIVEFNDGNGKKLKDVAIVPIYLLDSLGYTDD